jgi:hypothetical protein
VHEGEQKPGLQTGPQTVASFLKCSLGFKVAADKQESA